MAIAPTGAIYKSLIFDGEDSRDYGVYITGEAVYNAPERDVEMIAIPGRDGAFALDKGRFENIEVKYPAGIVANNEADFAEAISDFRNFLCSKIGYCRLEDGYNSDEYRMAIYKSGLEVSPTQLMTGEFELIFECKPQRYLKTGEDAISVDSGDVVTNPTLFASSPMMEVEGYGTIEFNGSDIEIENITYGDIISAQASSVPAKNATITLQGEFENGDAISVPSISVRGKNTSNNITVDSHSAITNTNPNAATTYESLSNGYSITTTFTGLSFAKGTSITQTNTATQTIVWQPVGSSTTMTITYTFTVSINYDGDRTITVTTSGTSSVTGWHPPTANLISWSDIAVNSSSHITGLKIYIDCDLGEAYQISDGEYISLNAYIDLGSDLPTLASGDNEITFDNTITDLKVTPRWWKI